MKELLHSRGLDLYLNEEDMDSLLNNKEITGENSTVRCFANVISRDGIDVTPSAGEIFTRVTVGYGVIHRLRFTNKLEETQYDGNFRVRLQRETLLPTLPPEKTYAGDEIPKTGSFL